MGTMRAKRAGLGAVSGVVGAVVATSAAGSMAAVAWIVIDGRWTAAHAVTVPSFALASLLEFGGRTLPIGALVGSVAGLCLGHRFASRVGSMACMAIGSLATTTFAAMFDGMLVSPTFVAVAVLSGVLGGCVAWRVGRRLAIGRAERDGGDEDGRIGGQAAEARGEVADRPR